MYIYACTQTGTFTNIYTCRAICTRTKTNKLIKYI